MKPKLLHPIVAMPMFASRAMMALTQSNLRTEKQRVAAKPMNGKAVMIDRPAPYRDGAILDIAADADRQICPGCAGEGWQYRIARRPTIHPTAVEVGPATEPCEVGGGSGTIP